MNDCVASGGDSTNNNETSSTNVPTTAESAAIAIADGSAAAYSDGDYPSETEAEKPVILEIGNSASNESPLPPPPSSYAAEYPLDMHLTGSHAYLPTMQQLQPPPDQAHLHSYGDQAAAVPAHLTLYNNAFVHHHHAAPGGIASMANYPVHIPQTVCAWPATTTTAVEVDRKAAPEVVPPAMYISYAGTREHFITKESNPVWKEKALQIEKDYKKTACDRERTRMRDMNRAFDLLRSKLPISKPNGKKYSKIESLRIAINYINHLQQCLQDGPPELELATDSTGSRGAEVSQSAVDYAMELEARRYRQTFHYEPRRRSYQLDGDKESSDQNRSSWSDTSYVPNGQDWD